MNTQQQANFAFKRALRLPCTNTSIVDPFLEFSIATKRIVYSNELYTNTVPTTAPNILYRFTNGTGGNISVYNVNTTVTSSTLQTNAQLVAIYGATDALWTALRSGTIKAISTAGLSVAVVYVENIATTLIDGTVDTSPAFYSSLLVDSIPQKILTVSITTNDTLLTLPNQSTGNYIISPESGLLTFFDNSAVSLYNTTILNLFPIRNATSQTWFSASLPPKVSCWLYTGLIGAIPSLAYDPNTVLTTVTGALTTTGNLSTAGTFTATGSTTLATLNSTTATFNSLTATILSATSSTLGTAGATTVTTSGLLRGATLQADGQSTLSTVSTGALTASSLNVTGGSSFGSAITGPVTFSNAVTLSNTLTATGAAQFSSATVTGTLSAPTISGATTFTNAISGTSATYSSALSSGSLSVSGTSQLVGGVSGSTTFNGNVAVASGYSLSSAGTGATSLGGALIVTGASALNGGISNALTINNTLHATGAVLLDDALTIGKTISMNGFITPNSSASNSSLNKGYLFGALTSTNYAMYMANAGTGNSIAGGSVPTFAGVSGYSMRYRMAKNATYGFVFENDTEQSLASINASTGNFDLIGTATVNALSVTNGSTLNTATISNASISTLGVSGTATISTLNSTTTSLGSAACSSLTVSGSTTLATVGTGALTSSSLTTTGAASIGTSLSVTNGTTLNTLNTTGTSTFAGIVQSGTSTFASGSGVFGINGPLTVSSTTSLGGATTVTGTNTFTVGNGLTSLGGNLTVTGASTLNNTTVGGTLSTSGSSTFNNTVSITGTNTLTVGTGLLSSSGNLSIGGTSTMVGAVTMNNDLSVLGNLNVTGTFTTVNTNSVNVTDKKITLASNQASSSLFDGGGLFLGSAGAVSLSYTNSNTAWTSTQLFAAPSYIVGLGTNTTTANGSSWSTSGLSFGASTAALQIGTSDVLLSKTGLSFSSSTANVSTGTLSASGASTLAGVSASTLTTSGLATLSSATVTNLLTASGGITASTINTSGLATLNSATVTNNLTVNGNLLFSGAFNPSSISTGAIASTSIVTAATGFTSSNASGTVTAGTTGTVYCVSIGSYVTVFTGRVIVTIGGANNGDSCTIHVSQGASAGAPVCRVSKQFPYGSGISITQLSITNVGSFNAVHGFYVYYTCGSGTSGNTLTCNVSVVDENIFAAGFTADATVVSASTAVNGQAPNSGYIISLSYSETLNTNLVLANSGGSSIGFAQSIGAPGTLAGTRLNLYPSSSISSPSADDAAIGIDAFQIWYNTSSISRHAFRLSGSEFVSITSTGLGIGTSAPQSALHVYGTVNTTPSVAGIHMGFVPGSTNRIDIELCASDASGDVIIDFTTTGTDSIGRIYYNFASNYMAFNAAGLERLRIISAGIYTAYALDFGSTTRQMINLYGSGASGTGNYGIGVQGSTMYCRSGGGNFQWYSSGVHSDTQDNAGSGGTSLMKLDSSGKLYLNSARLPSIQVLNFAYSNGTAVGISSSYLSPTFTSFVARNTNVSVSLSCSGILHTPFSVSGGIELAVWLSTSDNATNYGGNSGAYVYLGNNRSMDWQSTTSTNFGNILTVGNTYNVKLYILSVSDLGMDTTLYARSAIVYHGS
jgi:hypothetical protein